MAHTLVSAHGKWGLGVEVRAASSVLRERTGVEYHEETLRGLCDVTQTEQGKLKPWEWQRNKGKKKRMFPVGRLCCRTVTSVVLTKVSYPSKYQRRASQLPFIALP